MFWIVVFLALLVGLPYLYPQVLLHWVNQLLALLEERRAQQREQRLRKLHERIARMKERITTSGLDIQTRDHLKQLCDDYERDLRRAVLSAGSDER
jgi:hypothetical protein